MSEQIKRSDVSEKDIYEFIKTSAISAEKEVEKLNNALKESAKLNNENLKKNGKASNAAEIKATENAIKLANFQLKEKLKLENDLIKIQAGRLNAETQLKNATEKSTRSQTDLNNAYKKLVIQTRDAKNESKRLGAELLYLTQAGKGNTKEFKLLENQYKKTTSEAVVLDGRLKKLDSTVGDNFRNVGNYEKGVAKLKNGLNTLGISLGIGVAVSEIKQFGISSVNAFRDSEKALSQVRAGLESTGNVAGFTLDELSEKANAFAKSTLFDDDTILQDVTAQILTFTNISGDAFDGAQQAVLDISTRLGTDLKGSAIQVGKALNDPINGMTALKRVGVSFTDSQKEQIKVLQQSGDLAGAQAIILKELNTEFGGSAVASAEADGGFTQLGNTIEEVKEKLGKVIVEGLKPTIKSLKDFFASLTEQDIKSFVSTIGTLFSVLGKLTVAFVTFKTIMFSLKLKDQFLNWKNLRGAIAETGTATTEAGQKAQGFGNALKGIGWTALIGLAMELGKEIWNIASRAKQAEENLNRLNKQSELGNKRASERSSKRQKELQQNLDLAKTEKEKLELQAKNTKAVNDDISKVEERQANTRKEIQLLTEFVEKNKNAGTSITEFNNSMDESIMGIFGVKSKDNVHDILAQRKADFEAQSVAIKIYKDELNSSSHSEKVMTKDIREGSGAVQNKTTKIDENTEALKRQKEAMDELIKTENEERARNEERAKNKLDRETELIDAIGTAKDDELMAQMSDEEKEIYQIKKDYQRKLDLAEEFGYGIEEIENQMKNEINDIRLKYALEDEKTEEKTNKFKYENFKEWADLTTDYFIKNSEKKIAQIDKEISAAEKQSDYLQELAKNGNITAQQSIAEQQKIINEGNLKKQKEQKRIERLKLVQTSLDIYGSKVANGDKNPLLNTVKDVQLLKLFIDSLPAFESGTERTFSNSGNGIDGKGGRLSILHEDEKVFTKEDSKKIGFNHSNSEVADVFQQYKNGTLMQLNNIDSAGNSYDLIPLLSEIKSLKRTIENRPTHNIAMGEITQSIMQIVEKTTKGNTTHVTKYNIKK